MNYWRATRHPLPCLAFVLPLLGIYEYGVISVGGPQSLAVRNGADAWLRWLLSITSPNFGLLAPLLVGLGLCYWALKRRGDAPTELGSTILGMILESMGLAIGLWALSRSFGPMLESLGITLATQVDKTPTPIAQSVTFLGAGIYEEVIFRLGLYSGAAFFLRVALVPKSLSQLLAACLSSIAFAAVHHLGERGDAVDGYVFAFRAIAGLLFVAIYSFRGFGIAVGAHAFYDVLAGIAV